MEKLFLRVKIFPHVDTEGSAYECWRTETLKTVGGPGEHLFIVRVHLPRRPSATADVFEKRESVSRSVMFDSLQPHGLQPTRILCPWDFPGKDTGVGCHFLLHGVFPTQGLNPGLLHCRQILYHLSYQGSHQDTTVIFNFSKDWVETRMLSRG